MGHIPKRRCVGCMKSLDKHNLVRIVKIDDEIVIDTNKKKDGRGVYLCKNKDCIENAKKRKQLQRALKCAVSDDFYQILMKEAEVYE